MTPRFIVFRWTPAQRDPSRRGRALAAKLNSEEWKKVLDWRGVLAFVHVASLEDVIVFPSEFGFIAGPLFRRGDGERVTAVSGPKAEELITTGGAALFSEFWGPCCALLHNRGYDFFHVLRDPGGAVPLYVRSAPSLHCIFTDPDDFLACWDEAVSSDETMLSVYMVQPRILTRRTAIAGVEEVLAGERLTLGRSSDERSFVWRPKRPDPAKEITDPAIAASALRSAVFESAQAWVGYNASRGSPPIVHRLSGGLDSSIVLAALNNAAKSDAEIVCFHEFPEATPEGDERRLARTAAQYARRALIEHETRPDDFSYAQILHAPLPVRPTHTEFSHANRTLGDAIAARGARIVTSGQGGDQVLHRRRFAEIAVDAAFDAVGVGRYLEIASDTARLARIPIWSVFAKTAVRAVRPQASFFNTAFSRAVLASANAVTLAHAEWDAHPWAETLRRETPARAARAMHLADLSYYHEVSEVTRRFVTAPVLASQPVIETVLSIPPYVMTAGGFDRALARAAFENVLPDEIRWRSHKGDTTRFHNRVLERQMPFVRTLLLDGELTRRGLVDRLEMERALKRDFIADGAVKGALMSACMAELWLRRFTERLAAKANTSHQGVDGAPAA